MRLVGNPRLRRLRQAPMPLEICPGRQIWERYRNQEYLVFVDESFHRFFGFDFAGGNFCHAAVGVPIANYARLQQLLAPTLQAYNNHVQRLTGRAPEELKFTVLRNLPLSFRVNFTRGLVHKLIETGGFVAGFYSSTRGVVMEHVRTNLLDNADAVPDDHLDLYDIARQELLGQFRGVGQSALITRLLLTPFAAFSALLSSFDCVFRVRYDPRQEHEDEIVRDALSDYMGRLENIPELFGNERSFLGMESGIRSHDDIGLQLADIIAGEVREFFRGNPESLTESSTLRLITPESDEPIQRFMPIQNRIFKTGVLSPMSPGLAGKLVRRNTATIISYYYPILSSGMLTCVTDTGQLRDLEIPTRLIADLLD
ncbi:MAG: hypothetical protein ACRD5M_07785 [Candidatus Acidiferrales bacterium]